MTPEHTNFISIHQKTASELPSHAEFLTSELPLLNNEIRGNIIGDIIKERIDQKHAHATDKAPVRRAKMQEISPDGTLDTFFGVQDLWTTVDTLRYTPFSVVKALLVRNDDRSTTDGRAAIDRFSVAVAMRVRMLRERYGITATSVTDKQKHQYWDEPFIRTFFASLQHDLAHPWPHIHKVVFRIRQEPQGKLLIKHLQDLQHTTENTMLRLVATSENPIYRSVRKRWIKPASPVEKPKNTRMYRSW